MLEHGSCIAHCSSTRLRAPFLRAQPRPGGGGAASVIPDDQFAAAAVPWPHSPSLVE